MTEAGVENRIKIYTRQLRRKHKNDFNELGIFLKTNKRNEIKYGYVD